MQSKTLVLCARHECLSLSVAATTCCLTQVVTACASNSDPLLQPKGPLNSRQDESDGVDELPGSLLVAWSQAARVSEYFSKALFLTHVPKAYLVLDDQLKNTLSDAAQCNPDDVCHVWKHEDVSKSLSAQLTDDPRCGKPWGCVRFSRADHCDTAFRKLKERAAKGDDVVRVVFAPPDFMSSQAVEHINATSSLPDFGIKGPGYAPGYDPASRRKYLKSQGKLIRPQSSWNIRIILYVLTDAWNCSDGHCGSAASEPVKEAGKRQEIAGKQGEVATQGSMPACSKAGKGRASASTANPSKSSKIQKRSQWGSRMPKPRPPGLPPNRPVQFHSSGFNPMLLNVHGHRSDIVSMHPPIYPPAHPPVRPMMPVRPGELPKGKWLLLRVLPAAAKCGKRLMLHFA